MEGMMRRLVILMTVGAVLATALILINPVSSGMLRLALVGAIGVVWLGVLILVWPSKGVRLGWAMLPGLVALPFLLPGRKMDEMELRQRYVEALTGFEGSPYHWGGEARRGIDCSGLPRRSLRQALIAYGTGHADGGALRMALEHWWYDASAKALSEGYRGYTVSLGRKGTVKEMDYTGLKPGDLAVTQGGAHVLVYVGGNRWIQADPGLEKVATLDGRRDENHWFGAKVTLHRWGVLADP